LGVPALEAFKRCAAEAAILILALLSLGLLAQHSNLQRAQARPDPYVSKLPQLAADATSSSTTISVTSGLLSRLMEEDVAAARPYLDQVRTVQGADAARNAEAGIRGYYQARMRDMARRGSQEDTLQVPIVTVGGRLSFSAVSFDGYLNQKDPISVLFYGHATVDGLYASLTSTSSQNPSFSDQDGPLDVQNLRPCRSQTQWVLMGQAGTTLEWRLDTRGVQWGDGGCASGTRNHLRLFGGPQDTEYGSWVIATPHREDWVNGGHVIRSWQEPLTTFVEGWTSQAPAHVAESRFEGQPQQPWTYCRVNNQGVYQNVPFDGRAVIIPVT